MATSRTEISSDEFINIKCGPCVEENRTRQADKYCLDCKDYYCVPCGDVHKRFPALKGHKLLDKADFGSLASDGSLPSFSTQRCSLHPSKVVDMFCKEHDEVACASCIALNHRTCKRIFSIPEEVDTLYNRTELTSMKENINKTKKILAGIKKAKDQQSRLLKTAYEKEVNSVKEFRKELQTLLNNAEQETINQIRRDFDQIEACLSSEIKEVNDLIDAINDVSSQLTKSEGNKTQEFVCIKSSEKATAKANDLKELLYSRKEQTVSFEADQNIKAVLKQFQYLGKVSNNKDSLYEVQYQRKGLVNSPCYSHSEPFPSSRSFHGSCITDDGLLLLADAYTKTLQQFDMSTIGSRENDFNLSFKDYIHLPATPRAVCLVSQTEIAVSLNNNTVQFVSLRNKLIATRSLKLNHTCYGLAHKNGNVFISDAGKNVYVYGINGQQQKRISTDTSGNEIFHATRHIAVSGDGDRLFVADLVMGVIILDIKGDYLCTLLDPIYLGPSGVCTDGRYLFVCSYNLDNVVQIGDDYRLLRELGKVKNPLSVCFDYQKNRLIVTGGDPEITVIA